MALDIVPFYHHFLVLKGIVRAKLINLKIPHSLPVSFRVGYLNVCECKGNAFCTFLLQTLGFHLASRAKHTPLFLSYHPPFFLGLISFSDISGWEFSILPSLHSILKWLHTELCLQCHTFSSLPEAQPLCPQAPEKTSPMLSYLTLKMLEVHM